MTRFQDNHAQSPLRPADDIAPARALGLPPRQGMYDPAQEHDACGVGFVVNIQGEKSHALVRSGLEILVNLTHRGACGCDPLTGDGAGILTQLPHEFFAAKAAEAGFELPPVGSYGIGPIFLPRTAGERRWCEERLETIVADEGQTVLGWRDVPVDNAVLGRTARDVEPFIRQVFIARGKQTSAEMFEWKLYVIRKRFEVDVRSSELEQKQYCYVPSLSSRTIIYKGLLLADQVERFYHDLADERFVSALALVHQRYSTNTFPTWDLAHPFRFMAHNGEINTLKGNVNWMHARESLLAHPVYGPDIKKICPVCVRGASDSAVFDNALELLVLTGRSLPQAMSMLVPEPWQNHETMPDDLKAYYEYQACLIEPWDGPAAMAFTDGSVMGAVLDRNGLRPGRYWVTRGGLVVMASEAGVLDIPPGEVVAKGRLRPGRMFLVDTVAGRIIGDEEVKRSLAARRPYRQWIRENQRRLDDLPPIAPVNGHLDGPLLTLQRAFGYSLEDLRILMQPMAIDAAEAIGSMGNDTPLAVLSDRPQLLYNYFKQLFAQVTNPPLDAIREEIITSLVTTIGSEGNLLDETAQQCALLRLDQPILTNPDLARLKQIDSGPLKCRTLSMLFPLKEGAAGLKRRLEELRREASQAIAEGATILVLSDRGVSEELVPIPALLATSGVHHHLVREESRTRCGLVIETGEAREVHHFALLTGYGAGAVNPYLAFATLGDLLASGFIPDKYTYEKLEKNYIKAIGKGLLKVMSKMGISTQQSYRGAQIFEAIGLASDFVDEYFTWTPSRIEGVGLEAIAEEALSRHEHAWPRNHVPETLDLDVGGQYQWRRKGEAHIFTPEVIAKLQQSTRINSREEFRKFCQLIDEQQRQLLTLRGLLDFRWSERSIPLEEVEPAREIVKRFATGAMSYGSISREAHETLAIAMNRIGGRSNT
ncbi:MAG TPA: glutamate synthase central domain-containing protein, partial [Pirellulales bacterium]|nr:glutamate synthase central domain-containing protein [Pirellulales bacterium]